ncbi:MAG: tetratricopeptide repeat protein [Cyclobacteriaceae bacterium]
MNRIVWLLFAVVLVVGCTNENAIEGDRYFADGEYNKAVKAYTDYIKLNPTSVKSIYNRGRAYEELGQYDKAFSDWSQVMELDKKNTSALLSLSTHYYRNERYDQAAYQADEAIEINPQLADAHFWKGRSLHQQGVFQDALSAYNAAISLDDDNGEFYLYRGAIYAHFKNTTKACNDFRLASNLEVEDAKEAISKYCR